MHANTRDINRCLRTRERTCVYVCVRMHVRARACMCIASLLIRQRARVYVYTASCECAYTCAFAVEIYAALRDAYTIQRERECREALA